MEINMEEDLVEKSKQCLANAELNNTTYEVARDIVLEEIEELQEELKEANDSITWWQNRFNAVEKENIRLKGGNKE